LTDNYERDVLQSDPANPDSDIGVTAVDEGGDGTIDGAEDLDNDGLVTVAEIYGYDTDPLDSDTDGDGLNDSFESEYDVINATAVDTDGDGTSDPDEDFDADGLTAAEEQAANSSILRADTDFDGLTDQQEVDNGTKAWRNDTDSDGLTDGHELRIGSDPTVKDTDGDGISDRNDIHELSISNEETGVRVDIRATGGNLTDIRMKDVTPENESDFRKAPMVAIRNRYAIENATIHVPIDEGVSLDDAENLSVYKWETRAEGPWHQVETTIDRDTRTATAELQSFSYISVFDVPTWDDTLSAETQLDSGSRRNNTTVPLDLMFIMDRSGSMGGSRIRNAKSAAKDFVGALISEDRAGLTGFTSYGRLEQPLTHDHERVNQSIDSIHAGGGTRIAAGIKVSTDEFERNGTTDRPRVAILLSDGHGGNPTDAAREAARNNITIYTIGIGRGADEQTLRNVANVTNGQYFSVQDASELPRVFRRIGEEEIDPELQDSDGDGIPDRVEEQTLHYPEGPNPGTPINLDPNSADTDGDGIPDGEEITVDYRVDGDVLRTSVISAVANPTKVNTDGVGLTDPEEIAQQRSPNVAEKFIITAQLPTVLRGPRGIDASDKANAQKFDATTDFGGRVNDREFHNIASEKTLFYDPDADKHYNEALQKIGGWFDNLNPFFDVQNAPEWMPNEYDGDKAYMKVPVLITVNGVGRGPSVNTYELEVDGPGKIIPGSGDRTGRLPGVNRAKVTHVIIEFDEFGKNDIVGRSKEVGYLTLNAKGPSNGYTVQSEAPFAIKSAADLKLQELYRKTGDTTSLISEMTSLAISGGGAVLIAARFTLTGARGVGVAIGSMIFSLDQAQPGAKGIAKAGVGYFISQSAPEISDALGAACKCQIVEGKTGPTIRETY
jgi:Mg-chelatase subunit ChlD